MAGGINSRSIGSWYWNINPIDCNWTTFESGRSKARWGNFWLKKDIEGMLGHNVVARAIARSNNLLIVFGIASRSLH
jgi:hypothetical protein